MDQNVIRRKLAATLAAVPEPGGADKAWPLSLARAARDEMQLALTVSGLTMTRQSLPELLDLPPKLSLIAVLEGPEEGLGVLIISPAVMAGLIEAQTVGKVSAAAVPLRKPTRTDAAMVATYLDAALAGLEVALLQEDDLIWAGGFRYASFLDDPRPLGLLLEDIDYRVIEAELTLAGGAKTGSVVLALPADGRGRKPQRPHGAVPELGAAMVFQAAIAEQVMAADCELGAVLYRMTIPLSAVMQLKIGDIVPLPSAALDQIALEGIDGRGLGSGKLGQNRGMRAVRLETGHDVRAATGPVAVASNPPDPATLSKAG